MEESREHQSRNISGEYMTDDEFKGGNGFVRIIRVGSEEDEEADAQVVMVPQCYHSSPSYILTLDNKLNIGCMICLSTTSYGESRTLRKT